MQTQEMPVSEPHAARLSDLRRRLSARGADGFIVPLTDEHASEYVAGYAQRLAWLTGFDGSAGSAIVLPETAAIFIDGRYTLQAEQQVNGDLFARVPTAETEPLDWLAAHAGKGMTIGYDPRLHTPGWVETAARAARRAGAAITPLDPNPVDEVWPDQPPRPDVPAAAHAVAFAGESSADKRARMGRAIADLGADAAAITALDSVAWLFNIRGEDVRHTPVALAYALLNADATARLFIAPEKVTDELRSHLGDDVAITDYDDFYPALESLGGRVLADPATANAAVFDRLAAGGAESVREAEPCALAKACKNATEAAGARAAHLRDGRALCEFLHWLDDVAPRGELDELAAAHKLESFRKENAEYRGPSFDTISGAGPNGAIIHYRVNAASSRPLEPGRLYLVDSGGQYPDGTTDVTRIVPIGDVGEEERRNFTLVLKAHIALATLRFPPGTTGSHIDAIARRPMWDAGLDYGHGTGHGVGSYLAVHEGPQRIARPLNAVALRPGMILSNEPGFYKRDGYGIRIENLVLVEDDDSATERDFLRFETLTLAPIDRRLILPGMLNAEERAWLDAYHARVRAAHEDSISRAARDWLIAMTAPLEG